MPIHSESANFPKELERAFSTVNLPLEALKDNTNVYVGNLQQSVKHLTNNLLAIIDKLFESCFGGDENIRSLYIKAQRVNLSLPIYFDFGIYI